MEFVRLISNNQLVLGQIIDIKGEVIELTVHNPNKVEIHDNWKCIFQHHQFNTKILQKKGFRIFIYAPVELEFNKGERRTLPRLECHSQGNVYALDSTGWWKVGTVQMIDFNIKGFGFATQCVLSEKETYRMDIQIQGKKITSQIKVRNKRTYPTFVRYGTEVTEIDNKNLEELRESVLNIQLELFDDIKHE